MTAIIRAYNIPDAPFSIGEQVRVTQMVDDTGEPAFIGQVGVIEHYEYDCGCGQVFPSSPMIGVRFPEDKPDDPLEEFWKEELVLDS